MADRREVLLLGDSIRMSYEPLVRRRLGGMAEVVGPAENCEFTLHTLASLERWLQALGTPCVVHWNNGLHDVGHNPARSPRQIPIEIYRMTLEFILGRLQETGATIVFATSTPVYPDRPCRDDQWSWRNEEIDRYNATAVQLMGERGVPINDLHGLVAADVETNLAEDQIHLSEAGQLACAEAAAEIVAPYLITPQ